MKADLDEIADAVELAILGKRSRTLGLRRNDRFESARFDLCAEHGGAQADDDPAIVAWRARTETDEAKKLYRARASLCELMNAHLRTHHGVDHFLVPGLAKVTCVALLGAIASKLLAHATTLLG